ncbi:MAG: site-specific DNA-methyltransferase, partial [Acidobacteriia bacterium]|nr:site-specific DNA-methyltransferase [Terriglobia bacterium]
MMDDRLRLSGQLLDVTGIILVSIDDNELSNARAVLDDVFGHDALLCTFVWRRRISSSLAKLLVSTDHEYVLGYSPHKELVEILGDERDMAKFNQVDEQGNTYASMP